jgi:hypothetical protein
VESIEIFVVVVLLELDDDVWELSIVTLMSTLPVLSVNCLVVDPLVSGTVSPFTVTVASRLELDGGVESAAFFPAVAEKTSPV